MFHKSLSAEIIIPNEVSGSNNQKSSIINSKMIEIFLNLKHVGSLPIPIICKNFNQLKLFSEK